MNPVKRMLRLLLVVGALLGLFGQGIAFAIGPSFPETVEAEASMAKDMDCPEMAKMQHEDQQPCKGLTLGCIAQMGCVVPMTLKEPAAPLAGEAITSMPATWPLLSTLAGRDIAPEPHPPSRLS